MALDLTSLANLGFPEILLWLLTFAVVYGVLSHAGDKGIPKPQASRAIIGIVAGFLVLFAAPMQLITVLTTMSANLILVVVGLLVLIVFLEVAGVKVGKRVEIKDKQGKGTGQYVDEPVGMFEKYGRELGIALIIIAILIFIGAGGLELLGVETFNLTQQGSMSIIFFVVIILAIIWMINEQTG